MKAIRFLLFPFAIFYHFITSIRNKLYDVGFFKSTSFEIPVIAVGNLNVGGTGKTPQIEYLIRLLKSNYKLAVLSRGYKRSTKGFITLNKSHTAKDVGDEPLQFFKKFKNIIVAVDADRTNGIQQLLKKDNPPEVILLDDAFQHRKVKAGYYVLLTKYNDLFCDDFLLPTGNLREGRRGARRADVIVVTKCPKNLTDAQQEVIIKKLKTKNKQKVFFSMIQYNNQLKGKKEIALDALAGKEVVLVTGIANPDSLLQYLTSKNISFKHLKYPDHHNFSEEDLIKIKSISENKMIITTEKDYVRLENEVTNISYLAIQNVFLDSKYNFESEIQSFVNK